jgi:hypothetical protein
VTLTPPAVHSLLQGLTLPFCATPWGATYGQEYSTPDPLVALSRYAGEIAWLTRVEDVFDPLTGASSDALFSTHGYHTLGDGGGADHGVGDWVLFPAGLANPGSMTESVVNGGTVALGALPSYGSIQVANADGRFDHLRRCRFRRRRFQQWAGPAQWCGPSMSQFAMLRSGVVEDATFDATTITISTRDASGEFSADVNPDGYLGMGTAVRLVDGDDHVLLTDALGTFDPDTPHFRVMVQAEQLLASVLLNYDWTPSSPNGWELRCLPDGAVLWVQGAWARWLVTGPGMVVVGAPVRVSWGGGDEGVKILVNGVLEALDPAPYVRSAASGDLLVGGRP